MSLALVAHPIAHQLSLFGEPERDVYDHDAIMRRRAVAIRHLVLEEPGVDRGRLLEQAPLRHGPFAVQDEALYWNRLWCEMKGRTDSWCTLCQTRPCPVWDYLLDEARRVNAP